MRPTQQSQDNESRSRLTIMESPSIDRSGLLKEVRNYLHNQKSKYPCKKINLAGAIIELISEGKGEVIGFMPLSQSILKVGYKCDTWNEAYMEDYN